MDWSTQSYGDDDDDGKSISSESSGGGNPVMMINTKPSINQEEFDIYNNKEIGLTLRTLPNSERAQEMLDLQVVFGKYQNLVNVFRPQIGSHDTF